MTGVDPMSATEIDQGEPSPRRSSWRPTGPMALFLTGYFYAAIVSGAITCYFLAINQWILAYH